MSSYGRMLARTSEYERTHNVRRNLRPVGKPVGTHIDEMTSNGAAPILCSSCAHKFDARRAHYVAASRWGRIVGQCDGCGEHGSRNVIFIHESTVCDYGGKIRSGHVYTPL